MVFFFFKQKTAYEMSVSDWSSDVCSSDLGAFEQVEHVLSGVVAQRARLTLFGVPLFLWFSTRLFGGLRAALNEVFDTEENRPWPMAKLIDLGMVFTTAALLVASTLLPAVEARGSTDWGSRFFL